MISATGMHGVVRPLSPLVAGILTYNRPQALRECVVHMAAQTRLPDALVIWNNGAAGAAAAALADLETPFPRIGEG